MMRVKTAECLTVSTVNGESSVVNRYVTVATVLTVGSRFNFGSSTGVPMCACSVNVLTGAVEHGRVEVHSVQRLSFKLARGVNDAGRVGCVQVSRDSPARCAIVDSVKVYSAVEDGRAKRIGKSVTDGCKSRL